MTVEDEGVRGCEEGVEAVFERSRAGHRAPERSGASGGRSISSESRKGVGTEEIELPEEGRLPQRSKFEEALE